ncbi:MAG: hypothetical protein ACI88C_000017 [Acidimicrobiales bacterium]|jgi:hypothetical protein
MLVSNKHNFVWLHPPKTGGSSLTIALAPYLNNPREPKTGDDSWQARHHIHAMHHQYKDQFAGKRAVMFVRNPWGRVWSLYHSLVNRSRLPLARFVQSIPRMEGSNAIISRPCCWTARANQLTYIGRMETIATDFKRIFGKLTGLEAPELTHYKTGRGTFADYRQEDWLAAFDNDPDSRKRVADIYRQDLEDFRYSEEAMWPS